MMNRMRKDIAVKTIVALLFLPLTLCAAAAATPQVRYDLALLAEQGFVEAPEKWADRLTGSPDCDGPEAAALLVQAARAFRPVQNTDEALDVLVQRGVTSSREYWEKALAPGRRCGSANLAVLIGRIAGRLPIRLTRPFAAPPLEPVAAGGVRSEYDIVIAGAGTGGCGAAIQAARMGRSVLLLEETDWIGGQMTAAAVTSMDEGGTLVRERGLYHELCGLISAHYRPLGISYETAYWFGHVCVEPHVGRRLLHVMLADAKGASGTLDLVQRAKVARVLKSGNCVTGVELACDGPVGTVTRTVRCRILVDATECGDVIPLTGARYRVGNCVSDRIDPARRVQDNTWCAVVRRYPQEVPVGLSLTQPPPGYDEKVHKRFLASLVPGSGRVAVTNRPWNFETFIGYRGMPDSSRSGDAPPITRTHYNFNNDYPNTVADLEDPARRLETLRAMRLKTLHLLYYVQNTLGERAWAVADDEGYDTPYNCAQIDAWLAERPELAPYRPILIRLPVMAYTRESRRIIGLHTLTAREIERHPGKPVRFATCVALGDYNVDLHGSMRPQDMEPDLDRKEDIPDHRSGKRGSGPFAIPFECFIPETVDGFLPAEKNLSQSRLANGATRLQPHTLLMGQAVGAIAALAVERGIQPRAVAPVAVQRVLLEAKDTLFLETVADVRQNHPAWADVQLVLTHGLMRLNEGCFEPEKAFSGESRAEALKLLADRGIQPPALANPISRVEAARALAACLK